MKKILAVGFEDHIGQPFGRLMSGAINESAVAEVSSPRQAITVLNSSGVFDTVIGVFDSEDASVLPAVRAIRAEHPDVILFALFDQHGTVELLAQTVAAFIGSLESIPCKGATSASLPCLPPQRMGRPGDMRLSGPHLTRRQRDVLELIRDGYSNKQIARTLQLSEGTVKIHCLAIYRELGVANRTQAAVIADEVLRQG